MPTYEASCDRCGRKPPFANHFWSVRGGTLCDDCNDELSVFRTFWEDAALTWAGHMVFQLARRRIDGMRLQLVALQRGLA